MSAISDFFKNKYPSAEALGVPVARWRQSIYRTVFDTHTELGKRFEVWLMLAIVVSLGVLMLHSLPSLVSSLWHYPLKGLEWLFTLAFTAEYGLRLISVQRPWRYVFSFYGIIDLIAVLPSYLAIFIPEAHYMVTLRALRLTRAFQAFPALRNYLNEYLLLGKALQASMRKILVFLSIVALLVLVTGAIMFIIEGPSNGFTSIPVSIYWAISTVTTVGYGDVNPTTGLGRLFASVMMLLGWGILAVPTGIVGAELSRQSTGVKSLKKGAECFVCGLGRHEEDARFCRRCGQSLAKK